MIWCGIYTNLFLVQDQGALSQRIIVLEHWSEIQEMCSYPSSLQCTSVFNHTTNISHCYDTVKIIIILQTLA